MKTKLDLRLAVMWFTAAAFVGCAETPEEQSRSMTLPTTSVEAEVVADTVPETVASESNAGMTWEQHISGSSIGEIAISLPPKAIVVATVSESPNGPSTYSHPPTITFSVNQRILNSSVPTDVKVIWEPPHHDVDYNNVYDEPRYIEWAKTPMDCPKIGERFLLMLVDPQSKVDIPPHFSCPSIGRYSDTKDNIQKVRDALRDKADE